MYKYKYKIILWN